jgi:hypothetical protein
VPEIGFAGFGVAGGVDDPDVFVFRAGAEADVLAGEFGLEPVIVGLEGLVFEVESR